MSRKISPEFFKELREGSLNQILQVVQDDDTLCLELRGDHISIYYRGSRLFDVKGKDYSISFNPEHNIQNDKSLLESPRVDYAVENIARYKQAIDYHLHKNSSVEREYQQTIVRENNFSAIANFTDYFITDIEYARQGENKGDRYDMIAVKWLSTVKDRKNAKAPTVSLIEMKYGDDALENDAGIEQHIEDFNSLYNSDNDLKELYIETKAVFNQKLELGLIPGAKKKIDEIIFPQREPYFEVLFIIANHDPDKGKLLEVLNNLTTKSYPFPIRFAVASSMGYGLYANKALNINDYIETLKKIK